MVDKNGVIQALKEVFDPEIGMNIVDLDMVKNVSVDGSNVSVTVALTVPGCPLAHTIKDDIQKMLGKIPSIGAIQVETTSMSREELSALSQKLRNMREAKKPETAPTSVGPGINRLGKAGIRTIIAIASGKGGVGKSFVTGVLASELRRQGYEVGVLDADITGPSIAKIFGLSSRPMTGEKGIVPVATQSGIKVMSMNLVMADPGAATIWRGPIINSVIRQLYGEVDWGDIHFLLVDLPPGTSDAPLTVFQSIPLDGLIVVSTPQDLALLIVNKAINMARTMSIPILGLIENMSYLECPHCQERIELYGKSKTRDNATAMKVPFLGSVPFDPRIPVLADRGNIEDYTHPNFSEILRAIRTILAEVAGIQAAPPIAWKGTGVE